jgi:DnaJ-class molecular chaperone
LKTLLQARWSTSHPATDLQGAADVARVLLETPTQSLPQPYRTLELCSLLSTKATIKSGFNKVARKTHPDRNTADSPTEATSKMQKLYEAKNSLFNRHERDKIVFDFLSTRF